MYTIQFLAPIIAGLCFDNFMTKQGNLCNIRQPPDYVLKYERQDPEAACYRDGIFYPRCKDLENPEVWHYHNLLKNR